MVTQPVALLSDLSPLQLTLIREAIWAEVGRFRARGFARTNPEL
jgi:hypothetical protein